MGKFAARQIARLHRGLETETFHYRDKGTMATIGRGAAVLEMPVGIRLKGVLAWSAGSRCTSRIYLVGVIGVQTLINLGSRYFGPRRSNAIVGDVLPPPRMRPSRPRRRSRRRSMEQVARAGIEPATFHFSGERYYRLSYLASTR